MTTITGGELVYATALAVSGFAPRPWKKPMNDANAFAIYRYQVYLLEGKGRNEKTVDAILRHIWKFSELCGHVDFRCVDIDQIVRYKTRLQAIEHDGEGLSASTIVHALADVRGFFKWLRKQAAYEEIAEDLLDYFSASRQLVQIANAPVEKTYPTHEDVVTVVEAMPTQTFIDRRNRALISFAYLTGVRVGALITLRLKHVDPDRRMVKQYAVDQVATKNSKTMRTAWFPVGKEFEQIVIDWLAEMRSLGADPETPLFPRGADSELKPAGIPINYRPPFRFEAGHDSNQLPAVFRL